MVARRASIPAAEPASGYGNHFLVWSWRRIITGRTDCAWFAQEYDDLCGQNGPEVFNTLCIFLKALGFASRRQIAIGPTGWLSVTPDEQQMLSLLADAQTGQRDAMAARLCWISVPERRGVLEIAAGALAAALAANNVWLTRIDIEPKPPAPFVPGAELIVGSRP